jgi:pimeloyl-ACP methyl ester carboxylesterase
MRAGFPFSLMVPGRSLLGWAFFCLAGCAALLSPREAAWQFAAERGFVEQSLPIAQVKAWLRVRAPAPDRLTIYIEGDGAPWPWPDQPPADPTPLRRLVLGLAAADPSPAVAYLGRPCQYLDSRALEGCDLGLWTTRRFGDPAIDAVMRAVDTLKRAAGASRVSLVGYSGGGAMAALVATRRTDVACLVTLAAPLDTDAWTTAIGVSPLTGSRNPANDASRSTIAAQTHVRGGADRLVPPASTERFLRGAPTAKVIDLDGVDHQCCWEDVWPKVRQATCLAP